MRVITGTWITGLEIIITQTGLRMAAWPQVKSWCVQAWLWSTMNANPCMWHTALLQLQIRGFWSYISAKINSQVVNTYQTRLPNAKMRNMHKLLTYNVTAQIVKEVHHYLAQLGVEPHTRQQPIGHRTFCGSNFNNCTINNYPNNTPHRTHILHSVF